MIDLSVKSIRDLAILAQHALDIGKHLGFTEQECSHPNFSKYVIEELRNHDQALVLRIQINVKHRLEQDASAPTPSTHIKDLLTGNTK